MIEITNKVYEEVASSLLNKIELSDYFSGTLECAHQDFDSSMTATLIIYRSETPDNNSMRPITDIVPVWWEFHTTLPEGEVVNDFSFSALRDIIFE